MFTVLIAMTKIYVVSCKGRLLNTIDRKIKRPGHDIKRWTAKGQAYVLYKGKKYPVRDRHGTNINGWAIYPQGTRCKR